MGTDIHLFVEVNFAGDRWIFVHPPAWRVGGPDDWHVDRNYHLFGVLAGVRRVGYQIIGELGCPTDWMPMNGPGLRPGLLSGLHDVAWCTLDKVYAYDWGALIESALSYETPFMLREICGDFLHMIDEAIDPVCGADHVATKMVWADAIEDGSPHADELMRQLQATRRCVRLVYGFDS